MAWRKVSKAQKRDREAAKVEAEFEKAWDKADVRLAGRSDNRYQLEGKRLKGP